MKRKSVVLVVLIVLALAVCCLVGCRQYNNSPEHTHRFEGEWHSDASGHWLECECGVQGEKHAHEFDGDTCTECEYKNVTTPPEHTHRFEGEWHSDASGHWLECECGVQGEKHAHEFDGDTCTECDYICDYVSNVVFTAINDDEFAVTGLAYKNVTKIVIPNKYHGKPVTGIVEYAFLDCTTIESVTISSSIEKIGSYAFAGCDSITEIHISDLTSWCNIDFYYQEDVYGNYDFSSNPLSTGADLYIQDEPIDGKLIIPDGITEISSCAFAGYMHLTGITIPDSVTSIGEYAFKNCFGVTELKYEGDLASWCNIDFENSDSHPLSYAGILSDDVKFYIQGEPIEGELIIPEDLTKINPYAFIGCFDITEVKYEGNLASWCNIDFGDNTANPLCYGAKLYVQENLVEDLVISDEISELKPYAFNGCGSLTSVTIESDIRSIEESVFSGCKSLSSVVLGDNTTSIGRSAFFNCSGLEDIEFPNNVKTIGESAFFGCGLKSIEIPNSVESIGAHAFYGCANLTSVTIGDNVTGISASVFIYCRIEEATVPASACEVIASLNLKKVTITSGNLEPNALYRCENLTSVTISDSVTSIGYDAFAYCENLAGVKYQGDLASWCNIEFGNRNSNPLWNGAQLYLQGEQLGEELIIPEEISEIKPYAFSGAAFTSLTIGDNEIAIGGYAFFGCANLTSVTIGDNVTGVGESAFGDCPIEEATVPGIVCSYIGRHMSGYTANTNLRTVTITSGEIANYAFSDCTNLTSVTISDNVTKVGNYVFSNCPIEEATVSGLACGIVANNNLRTVTITSGEIANYAFSGCTNLTSVTIGDNVTSIGSSAFSGCDNLTSVTIGENVTSIGDDAFSGCTNLTEVRYEGDLASWCNIEFGNRNSNPLWNGAQLYLQGEQLGEELIIPEEISEIKPYAFYGCAYITSVKIGDNVTKVGENALYYCPIEEATVPGLACRIVANNNLRTVTITSGEIANYAFSGCTNLTSVTIGDNVTSIAESAFDNWNNVEEVHINNVASWCNIEFGSVWSNPLFNGAKLYLQGEPLSGELIIPENVKSIPFYAFYNCTNLTSVTIGDNVTSIGEYAFSGCPIEEATIPALAIDYIARDNLRTVTITSGEIVDGAFRDCDKLTSVTIGENVTSIGDEAFAGCYKLIEVYNKSALDIQAGKRTFGYVGYYAKNIYKPDEGESKLVDYEDYTFYIDGENSEYCLIRYNGNEANVTLPDSCDDNDYEIYQYAFYRNDNIESVTIGDNVTSIGDYAFEYCDYLANAIINAKNIGEHAFSDCDRLTSVTIGENVTNIGDYAFYNCDNLANAIINAKSIGCGAFYNCDRLTSVTIGENVTSIGGSAFYNCDNLVNAIINAKSIGDNAFSDCDRLTSVTIGENVTSIGGCAFYNCMYLKSITIGSGVKNIGNNVFGFCDSLESVYYNGNKEDWENIYSYSNNDSLAYATIYYFSLDNPYNNGTAEEGAHYWHYIEDNQIEVWQEQ